MTLPRKALAAGALVAAMPILSVALSPAPAPWVAGCVAVWVACMTCDLVTTWMMYSRAGRDEFLRTEHSTTLTFLVRRAGFGVGVALQVVVEVIFVCFLWFLLAQLAQISTPGGSACAVAIAVGGAHLVAVWQNLNSWRV